MCDDGFKSAYGPINRHLRAYTDDEIPRFARNDTPPSPLPSPTGGEGQAGFRPRTTRSFCFGKRTQNQGRPGVALRGPLPRSRW